MKRETFATSIRTIDGYDGRSALNALKVSTLMIARRHDPSSTADSTALMHKTVADNEFQVVEDAGQYDVAEQPDIYRKLVLNFVEKQFDRTDDRFPDRGDRLPAGV